MKMIHEKTGDSIYDLSKMRREYARPVPVALIAMLALFIVLPILGKKVIYKDVSKDDTEQ